MKRKQLGGNVVPQPKEVSVAALTLYDWMIGSKTFVVEGDQTLVVCEFDTSGHRTLLDELKKAHWIKLHQNPNRVILGHVVPTIYLYGKMSSIEESNELLLSRYTDLEKSIIQSAFAQFASLKGKQDLTAIQKGEILEYYSRIDSSKVMRALRTYLTLPPSQQYGEAYARGIIRREIQVPSQISQSVQVVPTPKRESSPDAHHENARQRQAWVSSQIANNPNWNSMTLDEQAELVQSLEHDYDAGHRN